MASQRTYISIYTAVAILLPGIVAAINVAVDPWGYFDTKLISGFNALKPELPFYEREVEAHRLATFRPTGLIMGPSDSNAGLDPEHPGWSTDDVFNIATGQCSISLVHRLLQHSLEFQVPKQVVIGLNLGMFNPASQQDAGISDSSFAVLKNGARNRNYLTLNYYASAFSLRMLRSSIGAVAANRKVKIDIANYRPQITATGMMNPETFPNNAWKTYRYRFQTNLGLAVEKFWSPIDEFKAIDDFTSEATFDTYRRVIRLACENDIDLRIIFPPLHAYMLVAQDVAGLTELWERWQKAVVATTANEAELSGCKLPPIWDFSGYNQFTTETIANTTDIADAPKWYWDPAHYKKELGDGMLDRVFDRESDSSFTNLGVRLTSTNIDEIIEANKKQAMNYRASHADEVALAVESVRDALNTSSK